MAHPAFSPAKLGNRRHSQRHTHLPPAVISEICYHPPVGSAQLPFVEITNSIALDVSGWRLSGGVTFSIPPGTSLAVGQSLAIKAFSGSLNGSNGERIRLEMPVTDPDGTGTVYVTIDEVTYSTGGSWGRDSDGGGSSLEKKHLISDGRRASNWADSSEPAEQGWVTIQATGVMDNGSGSAINRLYVHDARRRRAPDPWHRSLRRGRQQRGDQPGL